MRPYKPTGNLAVDMVAACINHAEFHKKKVKHIFLKDAYWIMFTDYVQRSDPEYLFDRKVEFDGVLIRKASIFQRQALYYELEKVIVNV
jgi:hypothetical protein